MHGSHRIKGFDPSLPFVKNPSKHEEIYGYKPFLEKQAKRLQDFLFNEFIPDFGVGPSFGERKKERGF